MNDKVEGKVEGKDKNALNQNIRILERLKRVAGVNTDAALAEILGIKPQNITQAKQRGIPNPWIIRISKQFKCDINELLSKKDDGYCDTQNDGRDDQGGVKDLGANYGRPGLGEAVDLLAEIIQSGETPIIQALHSNLVAFRDAVQSTGSLARLQRENRELKEQNAHLQARLDHSKTENLERRLETIERLYLDQLKKGDTKERREIMVELGHILGYNRDKRSIPINNGAGDE